MSASMRSDLSPKREAVPRAPLATTPPSPTETAVTPPGLKRTAHVQRRLRHSRLPSPRIECFAAADAMRRSSSGCNTCSTAAASRPTLRECEACRKVVCLPCSRTRPAATADGPPKRLCRDCYFSLKQMDSLSLGEAHRHASNGQLMLLLSGAAGGAGAGAADSKAGVAAAAAAASDAKSTRRVSVSAFDEVLVDIDVDVDFRRTLADQRQTGSFRRPRGSTEAGFERGLEGFWRWLRRGVSCCQAWNGMRR